MFSHVNSTLHNFFLHETQLEYLLLSNPHRWTILHSISSHIQLSCLSKEKPRKPLTEDGHWRLGISRSALASLLFLTNRAKRAHWVNMKWAKGKVAKLAMKVKIGRNNCIWDHLTTTVDVASVPHRCLQSIFCWLFVSDAEMILHHQLA